MRAERLAIARAQPRARRLARLAGCAAALVSSLAAACGAPDDSDQTQAAVVVEPVRTIRLPTIVWSPGEPRSLLDESPESLTLTPGAEDELPRGPQGFDVLHDGGFVVADPVRERLVFYDSLGAYGGDLAIEMPAMSVSVLEEGALEVRDASTGAYYRIDELGRAQPVPETIRAARAATEQGQAVLDRESGTGGRLTWMNTRGDPSGSLEVTLARDDGRMVSLRGLRTQHRGHTYVSFETTRSGDVVQVEKVVRLYDAEGNSVLEIRDIPLDYYVQPVDELRIRNGNIYQLYPTEGQVLINVWRGL